MGFFLQLNFETEKPEDVQQVFFLFVSNQLCFVVQNDKKYMHGKQLPYIICAFKHLWQFVWIFKKYILYEVYCFTLFVFIFSILSDLSVYGDTFF